MDALDILLQSGLITTAIVAYLLVFRRERPRHGNYGARGWNYPLKWLYARYVVSQWKRKLGRTETSEWPVAVPGTGSGWDALTVRCSAPDGSAVLLAVRTLRERRPLAEIQIQLKLPDGTTYALPGNPESTVGPWESYEHGWSAHGLKFQVLDPECRMRITYNGLLTRDDNVTFHVRLNLIWSAASEVVRHPEDWSNELASEALALEPWRDGKWQSTLDQNKEEGWLQYGSMQGRFESFDEEGVNDKSVYLQTRGLKERCWSPQGYKGLRRSVRITVLSEDGTVVHLRCLSYKNVLTHCTSGSIRFPNYIVESITSTDLVMGNFCETPAQIPKLYSFNVSSKKRDLKIVLRINEDESRMLSGVPYEHEVVFRTAVADIDGFAGSGVLELGYEPIGMRVPVVIPSSTHLLKHLPQSGVENASYCLSFEDRRAACAELTGGKGASLALLASVQTEEGYRVPPGFCLTVNALNRHLELNPAIDAAILDIEAANEKYEESDFKRKCDVAAALFASSEISGDVKEEILTSIAELRRKAIEQNLGPELRFAVRSSAVGEDSEVLSAAGQNETVLGCASDEDITKGVLKCWGSMFAFTSAYYRRNNGAECRCGGGVVVQALVAPRAAGVLFTRHPAQGDPRRLLITANFGLGESVVSGAVEPDTFIVSRVNGLSLRQTLIGSKTRRVAVSATGVAEEDVPASERGAACLTEAEALQLASLGARQEELWAAPRDIEWAIHNNEVFLLQSRPITSLDRWTEEELLHEFDSPIMADTELTSFGNTGEVLPRPLTAMSFDVMHTALTAGANAIMNRGPESFGTSIAFTHNRTALNLYNKLSTALLGVVTIPASKHLGPVFTEAFTSPWILVLPRPITPMSFDVMFAAMVAGINAYVNKGRKCFNTAIVSTHKRMALNLFNSVYQRCPKTIDVNTQMIDLSIHGHLVTTDEIHRTALQRRTPVWFDRIEQLMLVGKSLLYSKRSMDKSIKTANSLVVGEGCKEPLELWQAIGEQQDVMKMLSKNHVITSTASSASQSIIMVVLMENKSEFSPEIFNEIGTLLSSGDVLSAEVPKELASLSRNLKASGKFEEFRTLDPKDGMHWLKENLPDIYTQATKFLDQHGHRAIMEFEYLTKPWALIPADMIKVLQAIQSTTESNQIVKSDKEIIASLKTPQKDITRTIIKWLLPLCRRTVRHREETKAHLILAIHKVRLVFLRLGQELVKQWYIPNVDLVFFFRFKELGDYIRTRDPALLRKASQRQQYYGGWCKLKFSEINRGWVAPLQAKAPVVSAADVKIVASTVCGGEVLARACVVKDISEIDQLQQGDVLITHATDIGWSPYFPLISGIVTELGGLISHGAVIAREYGLPCIVGATDATDIFRTGDMVRLSANKGTLERVVVQKHDQNGHAGNQTDK